MNDEPKLMNGKRDAGDRHDADTHPHVLEYLERPHRDEARGDERAEQVPLDVEIDSAAASNARYRPSSSHGAEESELLSEHREDEVGVALGDEVELRLRALLESLAGQAAGPDRDLGLLQVVAGALGVAPRIDEHEQPVDLVLLDEHARVLHSRTESALVSPSACRTAEM